MARDLAELALPAVAFGGRSLAVIPAVQPSLPPPPIVRSRAPPRRQLRREAAEDRDVSVDSAASQAGTHVMQTNSAARW